jgi:hypothetical protein
MVFFHNDRPVSERASVSELRISRDQVKGFFYSTIFYASYYLIGWRRENTDNG